MVQGAVPTEGNEVLSKAEPSRDLLTRMEADQKTVLDRGEVFVAVLRRRMLEQGCDLDFQLLTSRSSIRPAFARFECQLSKINFTEANKEQLLRCLAEMGAIDVTEIAFNGQSNFQTVCFTLAPEVLDNVLGWGSGEKGSQAEDANMKLLRSMVAAKVSAGQGEPRTLDVLIPAVRDSDTGC